MFTEVTDLNGNSVTINSDHIVRIGPGHNPHRQGEWSVQLDARHPYDQIEVTEAVASALVTTLTAP